MNRKILFYLLQLTVFCNLYEFISGKPLIGENVRSARSDELTFIVGIIELTRDRPLEEAVLCSGSIVSQFHILTAGHCFYGLDSDGIIFAIIAESNILRNTVIFHPSWWITYNQYALIEDLPVEGQHDIAIVKLIQSVGQHVDIVSMNALLDFRPMVGRQVLLSGWGYTETGEAPDVLKKADVTVISQDECSSFGSSVTGTNIQVPSKYLCTRAHPLIKAGLGDSGGPVLFRNKLIAITTGEFSAIGGSDAVNFHIGITDYLEFCDLIAYT